MLEESPYNEWINGIKERVKEVALDLPHPVAVKVAEDLVRETLFSADKDVPNAIVYTNEGIDKACSILLAIMVSPDKDRSALEHNSDDSQTASIREKFRNVFDEVIGPQPDAMSAQVVAATFLRTIAGSSFGFYEDKARKIPIKDWESKIKKQFGRAQTLEAQERNSYFFELLEKSDVLATQFEVQPDSHEKAVENIREGIKKANELSSEYGLETVGEWNKLAERRQFDDYRQKSYELRDLQYDPRVG